MRGKHDDGRKQCLSARIIPAHAGQTCFRHLSRLWAPDHPRACGANVSRTWSRHGRSGSSPRMRGKLIDCRVRSRRRRIIPAHAGQTVGERLERSGVADHPRACGANPRACSIAPRCCGSSPRMRGKHGPGRRHRPPVRIIPAHAGQTTFTSSTLRLNPDHPRACGANHSADTRGTLRVGSSPRMRGKLGTAAAALPLMRIIPAHAGQTTTPKFALKLSTDHPRACGANHVKRRAHSVRHGSSPRMRGKHGHAFIGRRENRIIPAHAGQTRRRP